MLRSRCGLQLRLRLDQVAHVDLFPTDKFMSRKNVVKIYSVLQSYSFQWSLSRALLQPPFSINNEHIDTS